MNKKVIIIGTGLSGLSTGCYAQINGFDSHIFEHHTVLGGVAADLIDGGINFIMGHKPSTALYQIFKDLLGDSI